jgi:type II secretory pathway predicted ATPase ExeA
VANLLAAEQAERHRKVVFLIDEAHLLSPEQLARLFHAFRGSDGLKDAKVAFP